MFLVALLAVGVLFFTDWYQRSYNAEDFWEREVHRTQAHLDQELAWAKDCADSDAAKRSVSDEQARAAINVLERRGLIEKGELSIDPELERRLENVLASLCPNKAEIVASAVALAQATRTRADPPGSSSNPLVYVAWGVVLAYLLSVFRPNLQRITRSLTKEFARRPKATNTSVVTTPAPNDAATARSVPPREAVRQTPHVADQLNRLGHQGPISGQHDHDGDTAHEMATPSPSLERMLERVRERYPDLGAVLDPECIGTSPEAHHVLEMAWANNLQLAKDPSGTNPFVQLVELCESALCCAHHRDAHARAIVHCMPGWKHHLMTADASVAFSLPELPAFLAVALDELSDSELEGLIEAWDPVKFHLDVHGIYVADRLLFLTRTRRRGPNHNQLVAESVNEACRGEQSAQCRASLLETLIYVLGRDAFLEPELSRCIEGALDQYPKIAQAVRTIR